MRAGQLRLPAAIAVLATGCVLLGPAVGVAASAPTPAQALAAAERTQAVRGALREHPQLRPAIARVYGNALEVRYASWDARRAITVVVGADGRVTRIWRGYQAGWALARGQELVGGSATRLWVWLLFSIAFVVPFADLRRPLASRNLDLAALLSLSVSFALFNRGEIGLSVPLVYPALIWLALRVVRAIRSEERASLPRLNVPYRRLALAIPLLLVVRIALCLSSNADLDVPYFALMGADRLAHWGPIWSSFPDPAGNHYGPVIYAAYVPFEALWPYHGQPNPAAAYRSSITFDLLTVVVLAAFGAKLGGRRVAVLLAYAWCALPLTLLSLCSMTNDVLVGLLVLASLYAVRRPVASGALAALATLTKLAPALVVPLLAVHPGIRSSTLRRRLPLFAAGVAIASALALVPVLAQTDISTYIQRTAGSEVSKWSPFSIWGFYDPTDHSNVLYGLAATVRCLAAGLGLLLIVRPQQRNEVQLAGLSAIVMIALQMSGPYWLYPYVGWYLPLVLITFFAPKATIASSPSRRRT